MSIRYVRLKLRIDLKTLVFLVVSILLLNLNPTLSFSDDSNLSGQIKSGIDQTIKAGNYEKLVEVMKLAQSYYEQFGTEADFEKLADDTNKSLRKKADKLSPSKFNELESIMTAVKHVEILKFKFTPLSAKKRPSLPQSREVPRSCKYQGDQRIFEKSDTGTEQLCISFAQCESTEGSNFSTFVFCKPMGNSCPSNALDCLNDPSSWSGEAKKLLCVDDNGNGIPGCKSTGKLAEKSGVTASGQTSDNPEQSRAAQ